MKNLFAASILILAFCAVSFAQTNQKLKCPAVSVTGPAGIVAPGETGQFTANLDVENPQDYIFSWDITGGKIVEENGKEKIDQEKKVEGKGKNFIKFVASSEVGGESISATVSIAGLPEGCPNSASETMVVTIDYISKLVDEFSISPKQIDRAKLDNLVNEARKSLNAQIYIIERFERKTSRKTIEQKRLKTIDYLRAINIDQNRITFIQGLTDKNQTQFVLVPLGAELPICDDCEDIEPE